MDKKNRIIDEVFTPSCPMLKGKNNGLGIILK
jgi:hypothetical protein